MDAATRNEIISRFRTHSERFDFVAARRRSDTHTATIDLGRREQVRPTARELEVLQLIADGRGNREIGHRLYLTEETVKTHVRHLLAKLEARNRAHATAAGLRRGLIT